jgi:hypothetical protein
MDWSTDMKISRWALLSALAASLFAVDAYAQGLRQPASAVQTAYDYEYSNYYAQGEESPSDKVAPAQDSAAAAAPADAPASGCAAEPACGCESSCGCDSCGCDSCGCGCGGGFLTLGGLIDPCATLGEPCKAFDDCCFLQERGINVAGWVGQSFVWNTTNPTDRFNGPVTMTDRSNEWQLNQFYLYAEKATESECCEWDLGGRVDMLYGTDNRFTTAQGLETNGYFNDPKWSTYRFYGLALPQLYAQVQKGDLVVKAGHFYSPVGYEVVPMTGNFFYSLPYTFQYGEPFTHTGVLASYKLSEKTTIGGGFTRGWDNWGGGTGGNPHLGLLGTLTQTLEKGSVAFVWVIGPDVAGADFRQRFLQTFVYNRPLEDDWTYIAQSDFGYQNDAFGRGTNDAYWYGLNQYLFKKISDTWTWGVRAEWFRDQNGARVGGFLGGTESLTEGSLRGLSTGRFGYAGNFYEVSIGANWKPNANWIVRPGVRFDWTDANETSLNTEGKPFDNGNGNSQSLIGFDAIYTY